MLKGGGAVALPYGEVHMTNIENCGTPSVICPAVQGFVAGLDGLPTVIGAGRG